MFALLYITFKTGNPKFIKKNSVHPLFHPISVHNFLNQFFPQKFLNIPIIVFYLDCFSCQAPRMCGSSVAALGADQGSKIIKAPESRASHFLPRYDNLRHFCRLDKKFGFRVGSRKILYLGWELKLHFLGACLLVIY